MIDFYKYMLATIIVAWFFYELYHLYKIVFFSNFTQKKAIVKTVEKHRGYNSASIVISATMMSEKQDLVHLKTSFFPNLRWWLQKIPKQNDIVYFTVLEENNDKDLDERKNISALSIGKPATKLKLIADLFFDFSTKKSILIWLAVLVLLVINKYFFFEQSSTISFCYIYMLVRTILSALII
jgi:hypothetical protein